MLRADIKSKIARQYDIMTAFNHVRDRLSLKFQRLEGAKGSQLVHSVIQRVDELLEIFTVEVEEEEGIDQIIREEDFRTETDF